MPNKKFLKPLTIRILLFLSYALVFETTNMFIHCRSSLTEKLYPIPDKNGQNVYPFFDRNGAIPILFGEAHTYMSSIGGMKLSPFLGRILIKVGRNTLMPMTS